MTRLQEFLKALTCEAPEDRPTAYQALGAFAVIEQEFCDSIKSHDMLR